MTVPKTFSIFGAGPFSKLVTDLLQQAAYGEVSEYVVDDEYLTKDLIKNEGVLSWSEFKQDPYFDQKKLIFAVGYQDLKKKKETIDRLLTSGANLINVILSADANVPDGLIGFGNIIFPGTFFEPHVTIGNGNIFWSSSHVCHNVTIGDCNFFAAKSVIGGNTSIRHSNFIGLSASIRDNLVINDCIELGMGGTLVSSQTSPGRLFGTPARSASITC